MSDQHPSTADGDRIIALVVEDGDTIQNLRAAGLEWDGKSDYARAIPTHEDECSEDDEEMLDVTDPGKEMCTCFESDSPLLQEEALNVLSFGSDPVLNASSVDSALCEHGYSPTVGKKAQILFAYKKAIIELCDKSLTFSRRLIRLNIAWSTVSQLIGNSTPEASKNLLYWVLRHTLHLMLDAEWTKLPADKIDEIRSKIEISMAQMKTSANSLNRCEYILQYLDNPWKDERLIAVVNGEAKILTQNDLDCLTSERGCMIVLRLQKLCETKCDDFAFKLCSKTLLALRSVNKNHDLRKSTSVGHIYFIFDIYLCFVPKYGGVNKFIEEVRRLGLYDAYLLIRRNASSHSSNSRLVKLRDKVANLAANITVASIMVEHLSREKIYLYCAILKEWLRMHVKTPIKKFREIARKLFTTASSSIHLHVACRLINEMHIPDWNELLLELYVRTLTEELNELELLKSEKSCVIGVILENEMILSYRYLQIADLLSNRQPLLAHECILTAFSLNPSINNYRLVQYIAYTKYVDQNSALSTMDDSKLSDMPSNGENGNTANIVNGATDSHTKPNTTDATHTTDTNNEGSSSKRSIDFASQIESDISVLLSSPRVKFLSWNQTWPELQSNCQKLLKPSEKLEIVRQSLAVANDHLKYLNLDYNQFRNLPESDGPGIEKGYENCVMSDEDVSNDGPDEVSEECNPRTKRLSKRQGHSKNSNSPSNSKHRLMSSPIEEGENQNYSYEEPFANCRNNFSFSLRQLKQNQSVNLPFDSNGFNYILEKSNTNMQDPAGDLHALFRELYFQQIDAQFQLSQAYTTALQHQLIRPSVSYQTQPPADQASRDTPKRLQTSSCGQQNYLIKSQLASCKSPLSTVQQKSGLQRSSSQERIQSNSPSSPPVERLDVFQDSSVQKLSIATPKEDICLVSDPTPLADLRSVENVVFDRDIDVTKKSMSVTGMQGLLSQFQISTKNDSGRGAQQENIVLGQRKKNSSRKESLRNELGQSARVHEEKSIVSEKDVNELPANAHSSYEHFPVKYATLNFHPNEVGKTLIDTSVPLSSDTQYLNVDSTSLKQFENIHTKGKQSSMLLPKTAQNIALSTGSLVTPSNHQPPGNTPAAKKSIASQPTSQQDSHQKTVQNINLNYNENQLLMQLIDQKKMVHADGVPAACSRSSTEPTCDADDPPYNTRGLPIEPLSSLVDQNVRILSHTILKEPLDISKLHPFFDPKPSTSTGSWTNVHIPPEANKLPSPKTVADSPEEHEDSSENDYDSESEVEENPDSCSNHSSSHEKTQESIPAPTSMDHIQDHFYAQRPNANEYMNCFPPYRHEHQFVQNVDYGIPENVEIGFDNEGSAFYFAPEHNFVTNASAVYENAFAHGHGILHQNRRADFDILDAFVSADANQMHETRHSTPVYHSAMPHDNFHRITMQTTRTTVRYINPVSFGDINQFGPHSCNHFQPSPACNQAGSSSSQVYCPVDLSKERTIGSVIDGSMNFAGTFRNSNLNMYDDNTDTDTESEESDSDIELDMARRTNNRRDSDHDTDSSESRDLIVLKPQKTFSKFSEAKNCSTNSHQQSSSLQNTNSDQQNRNSEQQHILPLFQKSNCDLKNVLMVPQKRASNNQHDINHKCRRLVGIKFVGDTNMNPSIASTS